MKTIFLILTLTLPLGAKTLQEDRWDRAELLPSKKYEAARIVTRIKMNRHRYEAVEVKTRVPWYVVAALHNMESGGSFSHHLHEGSSLRARTKYVPKGRPLTGTPPFTWEFSAVDALFYDRMESVAWGYLDAMLYACERYNGTGYLRYHPSTPSPYLWSGTTIERPGKYIGDSKWSSTARSSQIGCAAVWKTMEKHGLVDFRKLKRRS